MEGAVSKFPSLKPFEAAPDDPLTKKHAAVSAFVEDTSRYARRVGLKTIPSGALLLAGNSEQSRRYVMAAVSQVAAIIVPCIHFALVMFAISSPRI